MDGFLMLGILLLITYLLLRQKFKSKLELTGPKGLPYFGSSFQIKEVNGEKNLLWTVIDWAKQYGPIFKFQLFGDEIVVVSTYDAIYEFLVTKSKDFAGRPYSFRIDQFVDSDGFAFIDFNNKFKVNKKITQKGLKQYGDGMTRIERLAQAEIERFIQDFEKQQGNAFDPRNDIEHVVLRILESLILGEHLAHDDSDTEKTLTWINDANTHVFDGYNAILLDMFPWLRYFGNRAYKSIQDFKALAYPQWTEWIEKCRAQKKQGDIEIKTLLETLIDAEDAGTITRQAIFGIINDTFGAGVATTYATTSIFLILMLNYPECQDQLHKEIQEILGNRMPELCDRENLPLMEATILEVLRYSSIVPLGLSHKATCDTTLMGHHIPKGTQVWGNLWAIHHDEIYYDQPYVFDPKRFLDISGKVIPPQERKAFLPFGAGRRVCVGEVLAKARLFLMLTRLVQKFEFLPEAPDKIPSCDMKMYSGNLSLFPPQFKLIAKQRCL